MQPTKLSRQMRILFDENFPADFAALLVGHEASNVHSHGWAGIKNGELLRRVLSAGDDRMRGLMKLVIEGDR